jgi:hypothetical protein
VGGPPSIPPLWLPLSVEPFCLHPATFHAPFRLHSATFHAPFRLHPATFQLGETRTEARAECGHVQTEGGGAAGYSETVTDLKRRRVDQVTDPSYVQGLTNRSTDDLKRMRDEAGAIENEISFERRLCQARIDILTAELDHRSGKSGDVISRLPEILADEGRSEAGDVGLPSRAPDHSIPKNVGILRRRVEEIVGEETLARLSDVSTDELKTIIASLGKHETNLSQQRRLLHEVLDRIQGEIVGRYSEGDADAAI